MVTKLWFMFFTSASKFFARFSSMDYASAVLWGPVDCNFGDGVGVLAQHVPNPTPSLPGDSYPFACAVLKGYGWRWFLPKKMR